MAKTRLPRTLPAMSRRARTAGFLSCFMAGPGTGALR